MSKTFMQSTNIQCNSKITVFVALIYPIIYLNTLVQKLWKCLETAHSAVAVIRKLVLSSC